MHKGMCATRILSGGGGGLPVNKFYLARFTILLRITLEHSSEPLLGNAVFSIRSDPYTSLPFLILIFLKMQGWKMPGAPASMHGALLLALHSLHCVVLNGPHDTTLHLFSFDYIFVVYLSTLSVVPWNEWMIV
jgi:hypothetical protein